MFLKSLNLRGFKSFADKSRLVFEPGVSVVVGPNGSGKSNICDAISWVLGEQGPRSLRGGKMEDVIFAGSPMRPALGMAEVSLVIDNSAGLLPIEFGEVTVSRVLFRSGESEYRLNGQTCRLLDIQELLSDTGIGREQHTIIGQGQLDAILTADPIQMRGFIEEAAGVAKHRRRKDRALRRLAAGEENLVRLSDMLREVRRTLRPLRQQAEVARRHSDVAESLRIVRVVLMARELSGIRSRLGGDIEGPQGAIRVSEDELAGVEESLREAETAHSQGFAEGEAARDSAWRLARQQERLETLARVSGERVRALEAELAGATEEAARARIAHLEVELGGARARLGEDRERSEAALVLQDQFAGRLEAASDSLRRADEALAAASAGARRLADEEIRIRGEIAALQASIDSAQQERGRTKRREERLQEALAAAQKALLTAAAKARRLEDSEGPHSEAVQTHETEIERLTAEHLALLDSLRGAERDAALREARGGGGSPEAARAVAGAPGVVGILGDLVGEIADEGLLRAAVGDPAGVVVVEDFETAMRIVDRTPDERVVCLVGSGDREDIALGATPLVDRLGISNPAARRALIGIHVLEDATQAAAATRRHPAAIFVTPDGTLVSGTKVVSGDHEDRLAQARGRLDETAGRVAVVEDQIRSARARLKEETAALNRIDAQIAATSERVASAEREVHGLERESVALSEARAESERSVESLSARLEALTSVLPERSKDAGEAEAGVESLRSAGASALGEREAAARGLEEARLERARASERVQLASERIEALERALKEAEEDSRGVPGKRDRLRQGIDRARNVGEVAEALARQASRWATEVEGAYQSLRSRVTETEEQVRTLRVRRASISSELEGMRVRAREEDLDRSEARIRSRILEEKIIESGAVPDEVVDRLGHRWDVEDASRLEDAAGRAAALDDGSLRRREARLTSDLARLGAVNPLAEQEHRDLAEREEFLESQIADVRKSRRDLMRLVSEVDARIRDLFEAAFRDVAEEYERLFTLLFPGGRGRLRLTDPSDLLACGVEVEARPGGKNLRRLSLLSGGEKALSALAFLFAIFRARPSPFYVLDEVEAALDDVNLHRFLTLLREFRSSSQLIVVTHQKRTMEAADVLYGVSITPEGASRVISQRLSSVSPQVRVEAQPSRDTVSER